MRRPHLNRLAMFDAAARHLNFSLAAQELNVTQGAVAQQVRALEADLQIKLFTRLPRGLALTDAGQRYHEAVFKALGIIDEATANLKPSPPRITLSLPPSLAAKWLVPRLPGFQDRNPGLEIATLATERLADFRTDGIDLAIRLGTPPFPGLEYRHLCPVRLVPVCSPAYIAQFERIEDLSDLYGARLLEDGHAPWARHLDQSDIRDQFKVLVFNHSSLAIDAAIDGQGIALVPEVLVRQDLLQKRLLGLPNLFDGRVSGASGSGNVQRSYYLVFPGKTTGDRSVRDAVISWIISEMREDAAYL